MKITFIGATHEVTGSCTYLEVGNTKFLVDYGMEQGKNVFENVALPVSPSEIDFVLLTHAHIDHSGNLPLLYRNGFKGTVYATQGTSDLCEIMLRDSAHIQEFEAEWRNRKAKRSGHELYVPLYEMKDAEGVLSKFRPCSYNKLIQISEEVVVRFNDIGHLLGSASIEVWVTEQDVTKKIVFSGDVGNTDQPIIQDPQRITDTDYLVLESTYGDRLHGDRPDYVTNLAEIIQITFDRGGNVVIPSFAVGRTQEILYFIHQIKERELVKGYTDFPVYVDSPLANEATGIFIQSDRSYFDEELTVMLDEGVNPLVFPGLECTVSSEESKAINEDSRPKVIISASGMCEAGRIRHHLKHNLWRPECTILFVGYQAYGTLGRSLVEGSKKVRLFGEEIAVNAQIEKLAGVSGHADRNGLLAWLSGFDKKPEMVFVNHGEDSAMISFVNCLVHEKGYQAVAPYSGTTYDLATLECIHQTVGIPVKKEEKQLRNQTVYTRLLDAGKRLMDLIQRSSQMANKDIAKFTSQIDELCNKWEK
ncbi:MAG: MBL fold metallo-hydrolase RNA specificity domain-containing protein [Lachnospiraceae bacterium]